MLAREEDIAALREDVAKQKRVDERLRKSLRETKAELAKCQDQIRGLCPVSNAGSSSRPTSFISVESDTGAESSGSGDGARPHSLLSYSSDNFPLEADTDPDTRSQVRS